MSRAPDEDAIETRFIICERGYFHEFCFDFLRFSHSVTASHGTDYCRLKFNSMLTCTGTESPSWVPGAKRKRGDSHEAGECYGSSHEKRSEAVRFSHSATPSHEEDSPRVTVWTNKAWFPPL